MFAFPLAAQRTMWQGQMALFGLLKYIGDNALGLCVGASAVWVANSAPYAGCKDLLTANTQKVIGTQEVMHDAAGFGMAQALDDAAEWAGDEHADRIREYGEGVASHVILDILGDPAPRYYILGFFHTGGAAGNGGHAIGVSFDSAQEGCIMDPNYGIGRYTSRSSLCNDLHGLLASYVLPTGHVSRSILLDYDPFGAFEGAH